jgi:hypothetical protein
MRIYSCRYVDFSNNIYHIFAITFGVDSLFVVNFCLKFIILVVFFKHSFEDFASELLYALAPSLCVLLDQRWQ